jgi:uncharacterized membrane protein
MPKKTYNHLAGQKIARIEALSDGLFAIAMTLLILGIAAPSARGITTEKEVGQVLLALAPKFFTYLLGFVTLGIFWVGHATQFKFIHQTDRHLTWLSIFFWMFVSIIPFSTGFLSEFLRFKIAVGFYWLNILLVGVTLYWHWHYAVTRKLTDSALDISPIDAAMRHRIRTAQAMYAAGAALCFLNTYLSVAVIILIQLNYAFAFFFSAQADETAD